MHRTELLVISVECEYATAVRLRDQWTRRIVSIIAGTKSAFVEICIVNPMFLSEFQQTYHCMQKVKINTGFGQFYR